ncbi:DUF4145 domain-containing protein [Streptomyces sp. NPDC059256]|uniref:DUF4145 domain-containing protein n=1 Tax=Streptomyces sp. NPDC059256 TaxID=3346794 RepID=UPI0036A7E962
MQQNKVVVVHPEYVELGSSRSYDPTANHDKRVTQEIWNCAYCKRTTAELVWWAKEPDGPEGSDGFTEVLRRTIYPEPVPRELQPEVPDEIRSLFDEAARAEAVGAPRLAGAGYRAAVEEICKNQGATKKTLYDKITELKDKLSPDVVNALHEARMVGNDSLHDGLIYSPEELADIAELVAEVTLILYVQPAQKAAMAAARAARRASIGKH